MVGQTEAGIRMEVEGEVALVRGVGVWLDNLLVH